MAARPSSCAPADITWAQLAGLASFACRGRTVAILPDVASAGSASNKKNQKNLKKQNKKIQQSMLHLPSSLAPHQTREGSWPVYGARVSVGAWRCFCVDYGEPRTLNLSSAATSYLPCRRCWTMYLYLPTSLRYVTVPYVQGA